MKKNKQLSDINHSHKTKLGLISDTALIFLQPHDICHSDGKIVFASYQLLLIPEIIFPFE